MDGEDLGKLLCRLEGGMSLTVPDAWLDKKFPGPRAEQAKHVARIAHDYGCALRHGIGVQTFEKIEFPRTG